MRQQLFIRSALRFGRGATRAHGPAALQAGLKLNPNLTRHTSELAARKIVDQYHQEGPHSSFLVGLRRSTQPTTQVLLPNNRLFNTRNIGLSSTKGYKARNNKLNLPPSSEAAGRNQAGMTTSEKSASTNSVLYPTPSSNSLKAPGDVAHRTPNDVIGAKRKANDVTDNREMVSIVCISCSKH